MCRVWYGFFSHHHPPPQGQIQELREENDSLVEKLRAEEERRKQLAGKSQVLLQDSVVLRLLQEEGLLYCQDGTELE